MANDLTRSVAGDCVDISAPGVLFELNSHSIIGPTGQPGIGLHVLSTAPNTTVFGGGLIEHFATGFQTDAANTFAIEPEAVFNNRGVVFNGPGALGLVPIAELNLHNGIVVTPAADGSFLIEPVGESNNGNGIVLNGTTGVMLWDAVGIANVGYGLWLKGASFNLVNGGVLEQNTIAGAYLGCHAGGPSSSACSIPPSNGNTLEGLDSNSVPLVVGSGCPTSPHPQPYGIVIDTGNAKNHIVVFETDTNSNCPTPGDTISDGFDNNGAACAGNVWFDNAYTKGPNHVANPSHPWCMD
ncbi:MAG TPA: hypothetical protein VFB33_06965 [Candidatus Binataceae bacterium]|nr:hypothetical protein [Candidatus Binataceae bacterium]